MSPTPGRRVTFAVALFAMFFATSRAPAQNAWQAEGAMRPGEKAQAAKDAKANAQNAPLSPNRIVGRVVWSDPAKPLGVVRLHSPVTPPEARLVARSADCTPRAILEPVPMSGRRTPTTGYRVTHGTLTTGLEVVHPGEKLLRDAERTLAPTKATPPAKPAPTGRPTLSSKTPV